MHQGPQREALPPRAAGPQASRLGYLARPPRAVLKASLAEGGGNAALNSTDPQLQETL